MADFSVRIRGGQVYTPAGLQQLDILIQGEQIAALVDPSVPFTAREEIDARGKWVLPGIIDLHAHTREPGYTHKEDFLTASQAAARGGVTTFVDMPNVEPPTVTVDDFLRKRDIAAQKCIVDFGHFVSGVNSEEVPKFARHNVTGFKIFQVKGAYPHDPRLAINDTGLLLKSFEAIAETGLVCAVHPFDQSVFDYLSAKAFAAGEKPNHVTFAKIYTNDLVWRSAVAVLLQLQEASGVRLHLLHTHAAGSLRLIKEAKARGARVTAEVDPKYFHLTWDDLQKKGPKACPGGFIVHDPERMEMIWRSLEDGTIDCIGTDHAPHTAEELDKMYENAWEAAMGSPQYDHYFSVLLTDVHQGKLSLKTLVRLLSENPAKILGLYPKKGALLPGSDADLVIVDPEEERVLTNDRLYTKVRWSPYEGWRVKGVPKLTMLRGKVIARNDEVVGEPGYGRYIYARPNPVY